METGYRWLRETYLRYSREGKTIAETGALLGFVSSRAAVWEADVGGSDHLRVDVEAEVRFWNAYDAGTGKQAQPQCQVHRRADRPPGS
jgi:hypothetical protein